MELPPASSSVDLASPDSPASGPQRAVRPGPQQEASAGPPPASRRDGTLRRRDHRPAVEAAIRPLEARPTEGPAVPQPDQEIRPGQESLRPSAATFPPARARSPVLTPLPLPAAAGGAEASESVVQVHIGRIEVRAVTPPAPAQPALAPLAQPKMSLEEYLRRREEKP